MTRWTCTCGRAYEIRQVGTHSETTTRQDRRARRKAKRTTFSRYQIEAEAAFDRPYSPDLGVGETFKIETPMQGPTLEANVGVPALEAVLYGTGATLVSILPTIVIEWLPWFTPLLVFPTVTGVAIFITPRSVRRFLMKVEEWTGTDIDGDGRIGNAESRAVPVVVNEPKTEERNPRQTRFTLYAPASQPLGLARYCEALMDDPPRAALSYAGGKFIHGAKFYGFTPLESEQFIETCKKAKLIASKGKNQGYEPTERGGRVFRRVSDRDLQEHSLTCPVRV